MSARQARVVIGRLQAIKAVLENPLEFYALHLADYRQLASTVAFQVLTNLRPPDADPALWEQQANQLAALVAAHLDTEVLGLTISLAEAKSGPLDPRSFSINGLAISDIERFVQAGRVKEDRDEPGKNLDERDDGKTDLQIAWRIMYALRLQKAGAPGLEAAIMRFLSAEGRTEAEKLLPEVLKAWVDVFTVRAGADFRKWVDAGVARLT